MTEENLSHQRVGDHIQLKPGLNGLLEIHLKYGQASLTLSQQGAQITSYKPDGHSELLWLSRTADFLPGKAIRGGIPLCWPWFGQHLDDSDQPQHGYARTSDFDLFASQADDQSTRVVLRLNCPNPKWQESVNGLRMEFEVRLSKHLWMEVRTINLSDKDIKVGAALHTYFQVANASGVQIPEIKGLDYKDKTRGFATFNQSEHLTVESETDRVYLNPPKVVSLVDPGQQQTLEIQTWGNTDLVVWNPWKDNACKMADFDDEGYTSMICIEPANALDNQVRLAPGEQHCLGKIIRLCS